MVLYGRRFNLSKERGDNVFFSFFEEINGV